MIDLNSGSGPLFAPQHVPTNYIIAEQINELLDDALQRRNRSREPRDYIGGSELGDPCVRRVYLNALKAPRQEYPARMLRIFEMGHIFETLVADWLKEAGFILLDIDPNTGKQFEVVQGDGRIKNHCDGLIVNGPTLAKIAYPLLWENKALNMRGWNDLVKKGLLCAHPKYYAQIQMYMAYFKVSYCLFTALNKNTAEIHHTVIPFELHVAQQISDTGVDLIRAIEGSKMPQRISQDIEYWQCRMCSFCTYCHSLST
jgi:hypothetical protein